MAGNIKNTPISVHNRLHNIARESSRPFNELLQHFAIERFIYRLSKSPYADRFILKGALMFSAWGGSSSRPTMDIDLLGKIDNNLETIETVMIEVCDMEVGEDGMAFDGQTVSAVRITEDAEYEGVRVRIKANLGNARISLQIDIGFGDVIVPSPSNVEYSALLEFPPPILNGFTMETTIAEKYQAMVKLGILNSRMKDFHDIWMLSHTFEFDGKVLAEAIEKTFKNRKTDLTSSPAIFDPSFGKDDVKQVQWQAFIKKARLYNVSRDFEVILVGIKSFLEQPVGSLVDGRLFDRKWKASGPWVPTI